jgi:hypothetical protein
MTDTLRDLLRESVADADMNDVAELAWAEGSRIRRRRAASAVAGVAAGVLVVGGAAWAVDQRDTSRAGEPVESPSPTVPSATYPRQGDRADGSYRGTPVWWAPSVEQEGSLPAYGATSPNPLPSTIDLSSSDSPLVGNTVSHALAAFAVYDADGQVEGVEVLGDDGLLRHVDLAPDTGVPAPVKPMRDPEGNLRIRAGVSMLSPSGQYLMFPENGAIRVLALATAQWTTIDTGGRPTWDATWTDDDTIALWNPGRPDASTPVYGVSGAEVGRLGGPVDVQNPRFGGDMYGLGRRSPNGSLAQSYTAGLDVPQPPSLHLSPRQSDAIGVASAPDAMLVLPQEASRQKQCCQVAGWLDRDTLVYGSRSSEGLRLLAWRQGTHRFWKVSQVVGSTPGEESVVASYARLYVQEDCCSG